MRIHGGARKVGGSCIELEAGNGSFSTLAFRSGYRTPKRRSCRAPPVCHAETVAPEVVISQAHPDNYGLIGPSAKVFQRDDIQDPPRSDILQPPAARTSTSLASSLPRASLGARWGEGDNQ